MICIMTQRDLIKLANQRQLLSLVCLTSLASISALAQLTHAESSPTYFKSLASSDSQGSSLPEPEPEAASLSSSSPSSSLLENMFNEMANDDDQSEKHIRTFLMSPNSHDENNNDGPPSTIVLLRRSGFKYELYNATSADGYVTQLVRIVNPLAKRSHLKAQPVVLYAGQGATPAVFLMTQTGNNNNRPLAWPPSLLEDRHEEAEHPTGSNGSLAIELANNGYDVWLVPARGVDQANRDKTPAAGQQVNHSDLLKRFLIGRGLGGGTGSGSGIGDGVVALASRKRDELRSFLEELQAGNYWSFSSDEIVEHEFKCQLDTVLRVSNCSKLSLISYSNGGFISFAFMAEQPNYASKHIESVVSIAPAVFINKFNLILGLGGLLSKLSPPNWPFLEDHIDELARKSFTCACQNKAIRESACKLLLNQLYGPSDLLLTAETNALEANILDYVGRPLSGRSLRQSLQASYSGQLRHYDNGLVGNLIVYNNSQPPAYNLSAIQCSRLLIVSGSEDSIVNSNSIEKLIAELAMRDNSSQWLNIPGYNHIDLVAGYDTGERINSAILDFIGDRYLHSDYYREDAEASGDNNSNNNESSIDKVSKQLGQSLKQLEAIKISEQPISSVVVAAAAKVPPQQLAKGQEEAKQAKLQPKTKLLQDLRQFSKTNHSDSSSSSAANSVLYKTLV